MISRFFSWWFAELASLLPASWRGGARNDGRLLVIALNDDRVLVTAEGARGTRQVVPRGDPERIRNAVHDVAATLDPVRTRVQLRLPADLALTTEPSLPLAAEENLREVLGFEMDRLTPFRAQDVFFSFGVLARDRALQSLQVRLDVVRRSVVDPLLAGIEAWSLIPSPQGLGRAKADAEADQVYLDFAPADFRQSSSRVLNSVLVAVVLGLAVLAVYLPVREQSEYRAFLDDELKAARREAAEAMQVRDQLDLESSAAATLASAKGTRPSTVQVLETVTRLLPDHTYLFRFELKGDELSIQGSSQAASSLIALLDASEWLTNVRFVSPVTRDARSGGERFHISARLEAPKPGETAATAQHRTPGVRTRGQS